MSAARKPLLTKKPQPPVPGPGELELEDVFAKLRDNERPLDEDFLRRAYEFSAEMHKDQVRRSGAPYVSHPLAVAYLLADLKCDQTCAAVGLLHDVLEDTLTTHEVLADRFGKEIAELVEGVTKIGAHEYVRRDEVQAETFRKLILASAKDMRGILVKLADRLHNMMTLQHLKAEARRRIARETLEIYAPIAHRLGMSRVQGDLEDLAFFYLHPDQFQTLKKKIDQKMKVGRNLTQKIRQQLEISLKQAEIGAEISYRVKRYFSIYRKLTRQGIDVSQLYDYLAFRVITENLKDTYGALGVVHQNWRPIPGRFKDYIAMPKPNLYQSLHTVVVGDNGQPFEVQMRTQEMDLVAEEGIAAHWRFKESGADSQEADPNILWLRQLLDWQQEVKDPRTFLDALKIDLYPDEVYVFTPKGDVFSLPRGATPLDFAYKIHTELGHHCVGARVNARLVPLKTTLQNGDMAEVLTNPSRTPNQDWLKIVVTSRAKNKIRQWLNTQQKKKSADIGRRLLEKEVRKYKSSLKRLVATKRFQKYLEDEGFSRPEDLYSAVGFGKIQVAPLLKRTLSDEKFSAGQEEPGRLRQAVNRILPFGDDPIIVKGQGDLLAYLARCCNPLPGENIIGYVTRGRGVSVHSADCPNVKRLLFHPEREIQVEWARQGDSVYPVGLLIETQDQPGMLAKLTEVIAKTETNIRQIEAKSGNERGLIEVIAEVRDRKHLEKLRQGLANVEGVLEVKRRHSLERKLEQQL